MWEYYFDVMWSQVGKPDCRQMLANQEPTAIGRTLRKLRQDKGLTLKQVGELAEMKFLAVQRLETSPKANPQLATLQKLAGALGVTVAELVKDVPVIPPQDTAAVN